MNWKKDSEFTYIPVTSVEKDRDRRMRAAYFTDFIDSLEIEQKRLEKVKKASGTDHLVAVMSGTYLQNGQPARENMASRMEKARQVGVEQTLELPLYTCLSSVGIYGYSASNLLTNAEDIDLLVLETIDASYEQLLEITYLLIRNEKDFQKQLTAYKKSGMTFYQAQAKAIGDRVEGGEQIMLHPRNVLAVECIKSLKYMYSSVKTVCIPEISEFWKEQGWDEEWTEKLRERIMQPEQVLSDTYGGYERRSQTMLAKREEYADFDQFAALIAAETHELVEIRKYFLRLILKIRKLDVIHWQLRDFSAGAQWTKLK